jgi:acyl dehydratase
MRNVEGGRRKGDSVSEIRRRTIEGLTAGDVLTTRRTFSEEDMRAFAAATRDYNPVHVEDRFAAAKRFDGRICHGLLVGSMLTEIGGQIGWLASGMNFRFLRPVYFGDTITCTLTITEAGPDGRAAAAAEFTNQSGERVLAGELFGILPGRVERAVLRSMLAEGDPTNPIGRRGA